jgi:hypothetical protein
VLVASPAAAKGHLLLTGEEKMNISERIRADSEAAPWVIKEVVKMEAEIERLEASFRQLLGEAEAVMAAYGTTNLAAVLSARFVADLARTALAGKEDKS